MQNLIHLIKLEYKLSRKSTKVSQNVCDTVFAVLINMFLAVVGTWFLVNNFYFETAVLSAFDIVSIAFFIMSVAILLYALTTQQKSVYLDDNKNLLHTMPVSKKEIYLAKMFKNLLDTYVFSFSILIPGFITICILLPVHILGIVLGVIMCMIFPLIPYALSAVVLIPLSYVMSLLSNRYVIKLLLASVLTILAFYLYSNIIFVFAEVVLLRGADSATVLQTFTLTLNFKYFIHAVVASAVVNMQWSVLASVYVVMSLLCVPIALAIGSISYKKIFVNIFTSNNISNHSIKTNPTKHSTFKSYFIKEFKDLFRSNSYSYTYFCMAIIMPIAALFCGRFVIELATTAVGSTIIFGTTLLVVMMFCSIICLPSATFISKEAECFWLLKTSPCSVKLALYAKALLGVVIASSATFISVLLMFALGYISLLQAVLILVLVIVYILGLVNMGIFINILRPNLFIKNKENSSNMLIQALISITLSFIVGYISIVLAFSLKFGIMFLIISAIILVFSIINILLLVLFGKKVFSKVEV